MTSKYASQFITKVLGFILRSVISNYCNICFSHTETTINRLIMRFGSRSGAYVNAFMTQYL